MGIFGSKSVTPTQGTLTCHDCGITVTIPDANFCAHCGTKLNLQGEPPFIKKK